MKKTLKELEYYCKAPDLAGALLLTGDWGCGKTYLIDTELRSLLKNICVICRVSLFGIDSIAHLEKAVMNSWINTYCLEYGTEKMIKNIQKTTKITKQLPIPDSMKTLLNFDSSSLFTFENTINGKAVVLVFDDLERSSLGAAEVFGHINNYCENLRFHTIIIANEEKVAEKNQPTLDSNDNTFKTISYEEIKEKAIQKTVRYEPDYKEIITDILKNIKFNGESHDYRNFLLKHEQNLVNLFNGNYECKINVPHNIRCFKCAILEFCQLYEILKKNKINELDKYLYSYIAFYMAYKSGRIDTDANSTKQNMKVGILYSQWFDPNYFFKFERNWIINGKWDQTLLEKKINSLIVQSPVDILRNTSILEIDEAIINAGFGELLNMANEGNLTLNEYVLFILNVDTAESYGYTFPTSINWEDIVKGIRKRIQYVVEQNNSEENGTKTTLENVSLHCNAEKAYKMIAEFRESNIVMTKQNIAYYKENIGQKTFFFWQSCRKKNFTVFEKEMAISTAETFCKYSNKDRCIFSDEFINCWKDCNKWPGFQKQQSLEGFSHLIKMLLDEVKKKQEEGCFICCGITKRFIQELEIIIFSLKNDSRIS